MAQGDAGTDTILIVDDSSFIVDGLIAFLKKKYRPIAAYGGAECLEFLGRETPSVIILDIMMEPMDGWETLSRIKENPKTRHIPVLMFSAIKISPEEARLHQVSIDDCLTKPVSPNKIVEAIEKVLARRDTNRIVTERWQSAGIPRERIDEYLSLVTTLEVDLSLCQNMKIQFDLLRPEDKNESDYHAMMHAVEERVLRERTQIETLAREMNDILEKGSDLSEISPDREPVSDSDNPAQPSVPENVRDEILPAAPSSVADAASEHKTPEDMGTEYAGISSDEDQHPAEPAEYALSGDSKTDLPPSNFPMDISPGTMPSVLPEDTAAGGTDRGTVSRVVILHEQKNSGSEEKPARAKTPTEQTQTPAPGGRTPAADELSSRRHAAADPRNIIPADPDIPLGRDDSLTTAPPGAGTDAPLPWSSAAERSPHDLFKGQGKKVSTGSSPGTAPAGFFARILSFVRSIFHKR